jgi:hypothetical protein
MHPQDAQSSLDTIHHLQDRTREEIVRQMFPLPYVLISALGIFIGFAAIDLPGLWSTAGSLLGFGLWVGVGIIYSHWTSVRRRATAQEVGIYAAMMFALAVVFSISRITAYFWFDVPPEGVMSQSVAAAVVTAVAYVAITPVIRRAMKAVIN